VRSFVAELVQAGKDKATVGGRSLLHRVFEVALEEDRIAKNPVQGISVPKWDRREPQFLTVDEAIALRLRRRCGTAR
jgi:site-specific recombinase XerC